jgi:hypothetical protein
VGRRSSASTETSVDFPDPERPTIAVELAGSKPIETSLSAATPPPEVS